MAGASNDMNTCDDILHSWAGCPKKAFGGPVGLSATLRWSAAGIAGDQRTGWNQTKVDDELPTTAVGGADDIVPAGANVQLNVYSVVGGVRDSSPR